MFILSKKLWVSYHIIKLHCSLDWNAPDTNVITNCILDEIKQLLIEAKNKGKPGYIICDCTKGELPPFMTAVFVAKFMSGIEYILEGGLNCSIIYTKSEVHKMWFNKIFDIYKPRRPVYIVSNKEDIKQHIVS